MTSREDRFQSDGIAAPDDRAVSSSQVLSLSSLLDPARLDARSAALADGTDSLTYGEYERLVGQVARLLTDLGVRPGDRVGVHLRKSVFSFVSVHGVIRAGGVMVPLDSLAPVDHLVSVVRDAGVRVLISDGRAGALGELAAATDLRAIVSRAEHGVGPESVLTTAWSAIEVLEPMPPRNADPDDPAYIIYTSGSTGRPKGIVHTHRSALAYARLAVDMYDLTPDDRLANVAGLHFDQSTFELYAAPLAGCAVTVVPDAVLRFPASVSQLVEQHRVTVWYSVPYVLRHLTTRGVLDERDLSSLRWILYGGESYPPDELVALMTAIPSAAVSNVYGPAELNQCTCYNLTEPPVGLDVIPIGVPWSDTEVAVLDSEDTPVDDEPGELLVASTTMMAGYWNRQDLTDAAVVHRTIPGCTATRWYRTGDVVRWVDGDLIFLGRKDNQVKLRGRRIELEAIDLTIRTLDAVGEVAVVIETLEDGERQLVAVVEPAGSDATVDPRDVRAVVAAKHPRVAVPADVVLVLALARTGTGKVDRNAAMGQLIASRAGSNDLA